MVTPEQRFAADKQYAYRALQDARQYNTDVDHTGSKAEALYVRLSRASRLMYPWSTDGTPAQAKQANEYLAEITSILSEKVGPASRQELSEQGGWRHHSTMRSSGESFASVHRKAVRENDRTFLNRELAKIWDASHAAVYGSKIYAYGSAAEMRAFAEGLRGVKVRPITVREQHAEAIHKRKAFGNP